MSERANEKEIEQEIERERRRWREWRTTNLIEREGKRERERERERENAELTGAKIIEIVDASFNCNLKLLQTLHFILHSIKAAATSG